MESAEKSHPPIKLRLTYSEKSKTFSKKSNPENHDRVKSLVLKSSSLTEQLSDEDTEEYDADEDPPKVGKHYSVFRLKQQLFRVCEWKSDHEKCVTLMPMAIYIFIF